MTRSIENTGLGFRMNFSKKLIELNPKKVHWIEVHPENYMCRGGIYSTRLKQAMQKWPVVTHGLTMGFGSLERHEKQYLRSLKTFVKDVQTPWHSDHLCFGGMDHVQTFDLLPIPFTEESAKIVIDRIKEAQDELQIPIAIENVSYYASAKEDNPASEADFLIHVLNETGAFLLLDVNNVFVNSKNHHFDPKRFIEKIPADKIIQMHIAGHHTREDNLRIDTHGAPICKGVIDLLQFTLQTKGSKPLLLERDNNFPPLEDLLAEIAMLNRMMSEKELSQENKSK